MKINKVKHFTEQMELTKPYRIAGRTFYDVENHFVILETETGMQGYGAASPGEHVTGESIADCAAALDAHLEEGLLGQDLRRMAGLDP